ncbi:hypothetical protein TKK_0008987 [Trichogramma kaykai]
MEVKEKIINGVKWVEFPTSERESLLCLVNGKLTQYEVPAITFQLINKENINKAESEAGTKASYNIKSSTSEETRGWSPRWLDVEGFKDCIEVDNNDRMFIRCNKCPNKTLRARFKILKTHANSQVHLELMGRRHLRYPESAFILPPKNECVQLKKIARAKLKSVILSPWASIAPQKINSVSATYKNIFDENNSEIDFKTGGTQCRDIIVNVVGSSLHNSLSKFLRNHLFTVSIDESTDKGSIKTLVIMLRYADFASRQICTEFYDLVPVFDEHMKASATAMQLFTRFKDAFVNQNISMTNIYAASFDNCNTMIGNKSGFKRLLENEIPDVITVGCPAHKTHLCLKWSTKELAPEFSKLINDIHSVFSSSHRKHNLKILQQELDQLQQSILTLKEVRWLSMEQVVDRIILQWDNIHELAKELHHDGEDIGTKVCKQMEKPDTICYFILVRKVSHELNCLNLLYQSQEVIVHIVQKQVEARFRNILLIILNHTYVLNTPVSEIDIFNEDNYLPYVDFYISEEVTDKLNQYGDVMISFCKHAFNFVLSTALQFQTRFNNFQNMLYTTAECLSPKNATSQSYHNQFSYKFNNLINCCQIIMSNTLDELNLSSVIEQWDMMPHLPVPEGKEGIVDFWMHVYLDIYGYEEIARFILYILAIPHGNADPEKAFSDQNDIKSLKKTCTKNSTLTAYMRVRRMLKDLKDPSLWEPSEEMINRVVKGKFYKNKFSNNL